MQWQPAVSGVGSDCLGPIIGQPAVSLSPQPAVDCPCTNDRAIIESRRKKKGVRPRRLGMHWRFCTAHMSSVYVQSADRDVDTYENVDTVYTRGTFVIHSFVNNNDLPCGVHVVRSIEISSRSTPIVERSGRPCTRRNERLEFARCVCGSSRN